MKLSTKGRYAMIALTDLAAQGPDRLVALSEIAERQDISLAYLEQLFVKLRRAEIVEFGARPGRRLPAGAAGGARSASRRSSRRWTRRWTRWRRGAGASGGAGRHAGAGAGGQALGAALGQRLRDAAPDPARRRGEEPARALPGGAGLRGGGRRGGECGDDERAGLSRLERDGAAPARRRGRRWRRRWTSSATPRRCMPRAGRRGR